MIKLLIFAVAFLAFAVAEKGPPDNLKNVDELSLVDSPTARPTLEVLMHLPPEFRNLNSFLSYLQQTSQTNEKAPRKKRNANGENESPRKEESGVEGGTLLEPGSPPPVQSALQESPIATPLLNLPQEIRSLYSPFRVGPEASNVNDDEDQAQRDKRTFMDGTDRETTTALPFWKRKKENIPFVTGRDSSSQKTEEYQPAQHRSLDSARESHSLKDLDKTVQSNEITRNGQDNYFSSTNRRTYNSRQAETYTQRTPKSVYDSIDYSNRRRTQDGRSGSGRNVDVNQPSEKQQEQFARQYAYPRHYDGRQPYYPFQGDVIGRGVEYYHQTIDPISGRIIYYANMPEPSRNYDPNFGFADPTGRSIYVNGRTYLYDPYGRSFIYPNDYRYSGGYGRSMDYLRSGRSNPDYFYNPGDKNTRNARFNGYDRDDRSKFDYRNRTYIIFDADENSLQDRRNQAFAPPDFNSRFGYPPFVPPFGLPAVPAPPPAYPNFSYSRNQFYPIAQTPSPWITSQKPFADQSTSNYVTRPFNGPEVQIPLSTRNRSFDQDRMKKT